MGGRTRDGETSLGRESKKGGGWAAGADRQYQCPRCNKRCCGAKLDKRQFQKVLDEHPQRCPEQTCHRSAGFGTPHSGFGKCKGHLGNTPAMIRVAARQEAREAMRVYGVPVEIDPEEALREEIHRTVGHVRWLADKVASLGDDELMNERAFNGSDGPRAARVIDVKPDRYPNDRSDESDDESDEDAYREDVSRDLVRLSPTGDEALVFGVAEREVQAGGEGGGFDRVTLRAQPNVWLQVYMAERKHLSDITRIAMAAGLESRRLDWAESMADRLIDAMEDLATQLGHDPTDPKIRLVCAAALDSMMPKSA